MRKIAVNEDGYRVGDSHPKAKLTEHEVELIRKLHSDGLTYATLAEKFEASIRVIGAICRYERRTATATDWK